MKTRAENDIGRKQADEEMQKKRHAERLLHDVPITPAREEHPQEKKRGDETARPDRAPVGGARPPVAVLHVSPQLGQNRVSNASSDDGPGPARRGNSPTWDHLTFGCVASE